MLFERIIVEGLAHHSFIVACERTRQAVVIDPRRDVDVYVDFARQRSLTITHAIETHIHADFLSGARELIAAGAEVVAGSTADLGFAHRGVHDDERWRVGDLQVRFLHTPGHTPEHISILIDEDGQPSRLFTGDTLFVGAVGRPDLLGEEWTRRLARDLYHSLFDKLLALDDVVEVHPSHGAGSLCGRGIGSNPSSTIGAERAGNPMLQPRTEAEFVERVLEELPERPEYFARMKRLNKEGPALLNLTGAPASAPALAPDAAASIVGKGGFLIDMRDSDTFGAGHPAGSLNIGFGPRLGYWAPWVIPPDAQIVLLADDERQVPETMRQLLRVGLEHIAGFIAGGWKGWRDAGLPTASIRQMPASEVWRTGTPGAPRLVDVRSMPEWQAGHVDGAIHVPFGDLLRSLDRLRHETPIAVVCGSGYRSSLVSSLLLRAGISPAINVAGGMTEALKSR